ncbi:hypothetical protein FACS1894211_05840 [Clostridia bacterium]|nr:hypothetical protein FACS1894211_05840 [Clostridia bacterium]
MKFTQKFKFNKREILVDIGFCLWYHSSRYGKAQYPYRPLKKSAATLGRYGPANQKGELNV